MARAQITAAVRGWFAAQDFVEAEPSALQVSPGAEAHLHAFTTEAIGSDGRRTSLYLHTSPEFACKKLLAAGETRLMTLGKVWRNRERGPQHHPEFTMLEWYRAHAPYQDLMDDCAALLRLAAETAETAEFRWRGSACDPLAIPERLTVAEALTEFAGVDLLALLDDRDGLAAVAGVRVSADDTWADIFSRILVEKIEPRLGIGRPTVLCEYPTSRAALARVCDHDPRVAERFELYVHGMELANAYTELNDPITQEAIEWLGQVLAVLDT